MPRLTIYVSDDEKEMFDSVANFHGSKISALAREWHINKLNREHAKVFNKVMADLASDKNE